ncbi:MAG: aldolase catalytic domain-containing protein [Eubacteriales bacterium]|nr:aldolase catalytic domain-containing protein [Eubacteriales bacterium]
MEQKGELVSFRPDIKVVDCTLRDGGLVNNFEFTDEFVRDLYKANVAAGIDYMEFGYKASKEVFNVEDFGKWKFCDEKGIREIVGDNNTDLKISVMADVGRTDFRKDIGPKSESVVDMVRVATYINTIPAAIEMINYCADMGYEVTINIMAISTASETELDLALELLASQSKASVIYLVDSYGSLYPEQIRRLADKYLKVAEKYGKSVGIHAHNNQQLAFANTIEAATIGVSFLDVTMSGMGRGAGNCYTELLMGFLRNPKYRISPVLKFIEKQIVPLKNSGVVWGCDVQYMLTGQTNQHPRTAIAFTGEKRTDYDAFYTSITNYE